MEIILLVNNVLNICTRIMWNLHMYIVINIQCTFIIINTIYITNSIPVWYRVNIDSGVGPLQYLWS